MTSVGSGAQVYVLDFTSAGSTNMAVNQGQQGDTYEMKVIVPNNDKPNETKTSKGTLVSVSQNDQGRVLELKPSNPAVSFSITQENAGEMNGITGTVTYVDSTNDVVDSAMVPVGNNTSGLTGHG